MSRHENQNKKTRQKWRYVYRKIDITQRINIEDTEQRSQIRAVEGKKLHMKKHYGGSKILFLESGALSMSLQICFAFTKY